MPENQDFINLEKVIEKKNPKLLKWLPKGVLNYIKRIVHVEDLNRFIRENNDKAGLDLIQAALEEFHANIIVEGLENLPGEGRFIVASNHPLGGLDGLALIHVVGKVHKDLLFPVNDLLMNVPNLQSLFVPINKHGSNLSNLETINKAFSSNSVILYFPAGLCSRKQAGGILDLDWQKSFVTRARKFQRDIVPVHITGENSKFFYNLANLRKRFKIKANLEMFYLVDEMYKQRNRDLRILFGRPIPYTLLDNSRSDWEWARLIKNHVYQLAEDRDLLFAVE